MRTLIITLACAAVLALSGVSQAAQIASPILYGNEDQVFAQCIVVNSGTTPLTVTLKILDSFGLTVATDNCDGSLDAEEFCTRALAIDNQTAYACIATAGSVATLRGTLVLEEKVPNPSTGGTFRRPIRSAPLW